MMKWSKEWIEELKKPLSAEEKEIAEADNYEEEKEKFQEENFKRGF